MADDRHPFQAQVGKLARELGWRARESFDSGLAKTVRWYLENRAWWRHTLDGGYRGQRLGLGRAGP